MSLNYEPKQSLDVCRAPMQLRRPACRHRTGAKSRVYIPGGSAIRNIAAPVHGVLASARMEINDKATSRWRLTAASTAVSRHQRVAKHRDISPKHAAVAISEDQKATHSRAGMTVFSSAE